MPIALPDPATLWRSDLERRYTLATKEIEKLRTVIQELIDLAGPCYAAVDRRWCANSQGDCIGEGIIARARTLIQPR